MPYFIYAEREHRPLHLTKSHSWQEARQVAWQVLSELIDDEQGYDEIGGAQLAAAQLVAAAEEEPGVPKVLHPWKDRWHVDWTSLVRCRYTEDGTADPEEWTNWAKEATGWGMTSQSD